MIGAILGKLLFVRISICKTSVRSKGHVLHNMRRFIGVVRITIEMASPKMIPKAHHCGPRNINQ